MRKAYCTLILMLGFNFLVSHSQAQMEIECGNIIESEFSESRETHTYFIYLQAGDSLAITANTYGDYSKFLVIEIYSPEGEEIEQHCCDISNASLQTGVLSQRGTYEIYVANSNRGGTLYTMNISCTLRDGTRIAAGSTNNNSSNNTNNTQNAAGISFSGIARQNFGNINPITIRNGDIEEGSINSPEANAEAFLFSADRNDDVLLIVFRTSGDISLGIVVFSEDETIMLQASLMYADGIATSFSAPDDGDYTIVIYPLEDYSDSDAGRTEFEVEVEIE